MTEKKKLIVRFEFPEDGVSLREFSAMLIAIQDAMPSCDVVTTNDGLKNGVLND